MPDREAKKKTEIKNPRSVHRLKSANRRKVLKRTSAGMSFIRIPAMKIRLRIRLPGKCTLWEWMIQLSRFSFPCMTRKK